MPAETTPRRGRPPANIDPATLPPVARVLRAGLASRGITSSVAVAAATGIPARTAVHLLTGTVDPRVTTVGAILRAIRPGDKDGGWGWFGRELAK